MPMAKEADFYSPGEVAQALGISERQVFGLLVSGELEGRQDEWARWRVSASAIRHVQRTPEPAATTGDDEDSQTARNDSSDDAATTTRIDGPPPWRSPGAGGGQEEEVGGAPASDSDEEATQNLPRVGYLGPLAPAAVPNEADPELDEGAGSSAEARELRTRLQLAEQTRSDLKKEVRRLREENERLREALEVKKDKGVFNKLFGE